MDTASAERVWDFEDGTQNWVYDDRWSGGSYNGGGECSYDSEKGMLKVSVDFSTMSVMDGARLELAFQKKVELIILSLLH